MAEYIDQDLGTRRRVVLEPKMVGRVIGEPAAFVTSTTGKALGPGAAQPCPRCGQVHAA
ncbi:hypothetical protein LCGC14_3013540, partial [marine sediment metagenome]